MPMKSHNTVRTPLAAITFLVIVTGGGCTTLSGGQEHYFVCPYDTVWDAAVESVKDHPVTLQDKEKGLIETGWVEIEGRERPYGIFRREGFGNKERARLTLTLTPQRDVTAVSVLETRQRWHARGGVTQQATRWWPIDPSAEAMNAVRARLHAKLREKGCSST